jgi:hypothetical protein
MWVCVGVLMCVSVLLYVDRYVGVCVGVLMCVLGCVCGNVYMDMCGCVFSVTSVDPLHGG